MLARLPQPVHTWRSRISSIAFVVLIVLPSTPPFEAVDLGEVLGASQLSLARPSPAPIGKAAHRNGVPSFVRYTGRHNLRAKSRSSGKFSQTSSPVEDRFADSTSSYQPAIPRPGSQHSTVLRI